MSQESLARYADDWAKQALGIAFYSWASNRGTPVTPEELSSLLQVRWIMPGQCVKLVIELDKEKIKGDYWLSGYNLYGEDPFALMLRHYRSITSEEAGLVEEIVKRYFPLVKIIHCYHCESILTTDEVDNDWYCQTCLNLLSQPKGMAGYVYLFGSRETGYYKIGRSASPRARLGHYQSTMLPFEVEMICMIPVDDMVRAEKEIHTRYQKQRTSGEWFKLPPSELELILTIQAYRAGEWVTR